MSHDQVFKALLHACFPEFIQLFFPHLAARIDFSSITFLDKEAFTDVPGGDRRDADVVARLATVDGDTEIVLIHVEIESERRKGFPERMFEYYRLLRRRYRLPVFPIVIYLAPGAGGLTHETYEEHVFGERVVEFRYRCIGLPDMRGEDFREVGNPLGSALAALMRPGPEGRPHHKAICLLGVVRAEVDEARRYLLHYVVDRYLELDEAETAEFAALIATEPLQEVKEMLISPMEERAMQRGVEQGRLFGKKELLREAAQVRFGTIPPALQTEIDRAESAEAIRELMERIVLQAWPIG